MNKHTPGPWVDLGNTQVGYIYPQPSRNGPVIVADTYANKPTFMSVEEAKANARLIAAAPELLQELKQGLSLLQIIEKETGYCTTVTQGEWTRLIARATGQE